MKNPNGPSIEQVDDWNDALADLEAKHGSQQRVVRHDHQCSCGMATHTPHETGTCGCVRYMTEAPAVRPDDRWFVDGHEITDYTLRQQRGYHQHECGCWSRWPGSENSIRA